MVSREATQRVRRFAAGAAVAIASALAVGAFSFRLTSTGDQHEAQFSVAREARQTAETQLRSGQCDIAERSCRRGLEALDKLADRLPDESRYRHERASLVEMLGQCQAVRGIFFEAIPAYKEAIDLWSNRLARSPTAFDVRCRLSNCLRTLGTLYRDAGRWDDAESTYFRGRLLCEKLPESLFADPRVTRDRVGFLDQLGRLFSETGRQSEAIECETIAVKTQRALVATSAGTSEDRELLAMLLINLAGVCTGMTQSAGALGALAEACEVASGLQSDFPGSARYGDLAATVQENLADIVKSDTTRGAEACDILGRALAIREKFVAGVTGSPEELAKLAATCESLARVCRDQRAIDAALAAYRKALVYQSRLASEKPNVTSYRFDHGRILHNMADLLWECGQPKEAVLLASQAVEQLGVVYRENLANTRYRTALSYARWTLCALLLDRDDVPGAAQAVAEYLKIEPDGYEEPLEAARFLCRCTERCRVDAKLALSERELSAGTYADQAMSAIVIAVRNGFRDLRDLKSASVYNPLRAREDFQRLLRDIESKGEP
jgi:tetratricopeptide (TPR) repeat protein